MNRKEMHIHLMGICGTGMTSLASLLKDEGHRVTGSDQNVYPPMSTQLEKLGIPVCEGYRPENLHPQPDLVVIGNVITKTNPEAEEVLRHNLPYLSMPQALAELFLKDRTPIVVAGTHGKTTLSTMTAWLLEAAGADPGFFIGGIGKNFGTGARKGTGTFFVIEGDEYDTAFFDKGPKFLHYRPNIAILTSIEFDHADIYRDLDHLMTSFKKLVAIMPPDGLLIACGDYPTVHDVVRDARCRVAFYGLEEGDYHAHNVRVQERGTSFDLVGPRGTIALTSPLFGDHNLQNAIAAAACLIEAGIAPEKLQKGLPLFQSVARRQELVGDSGGITIIDDFAHHPTAVAKTIASIRARYPERRLWAIFEPRSNTSRRNIFQHEFAESFAKADIAVIASINNPEKIPEGERLDTDLLVRDIARAGTEAHHLPDVAKIDAHVTSHARAGDVILIMSNGSFGGLAQKLFNNIKKQ